MVDEMNWMALACEHNKDGVVVRQGIIQKFYLGIGSHRSIIL